MARQSKSDPSIVHAPPSPAGPRFWLALIVVGMLARLAVSAISLGTNDAAAWLRFADEINQHGLLKTYAIDPDFNHPPIPGYWAALCGKLAGPEDSPWHDWRFTSAFKLAPIAADCVGIYLLYLIWRRRLGRRPEALVVATLFALSLDAILASGFHCNTDPVYVMLCVLAIYLLEDRAKPFWGGFALGAAINVKIIPVLLIPPLLLSCRTPREAARVVTGLAVWVIPFLPPVLFARGRFLANVLQYNSVLDKWGINYFLLMGESAFAPGRRGEQVAAAYYTWARYLILGLILFWAIVARWRQPRWNRYEMAVVTFAVFLVLAPGFGVQYTVLDGLPLLAIRPAWGAAYAWVAGLFLAAVYFVYWVRGTFPVYSHWRTLFPEPAATLGLLTWATLITIIVVSIVRPVGRARQDMII